MPNDEKSPDVMQAHLGCDLNFLVGKGGAAVPRPAH
jgi:hypothetical protein